MKNIAIFPGSFDPFTNAHLYVVNQARHIYTKVHILIGSNGRKKNMFTPQERADMINSLIKRYGWEEEVEVEIWDGLVTEYVADFLKMYDNVHIIRGLRSNNGTEEFDLASTYYEDFGLSHQGSALQTIMIPVLNKDYVNISSSRVREYLVRIKQNENMWGYVEAYCPKPIFRYIKDSMGLKLY